MMHIQYVECGILFGLVLACTIMFTTTIDGYKSVFAQITPAPEKFGSNDDTTDSSRNIGDDNNNLQGITPSEETGDATTTEETTHLADSNDIDSKQTTTTTEQDPDPTNQLVESIMNEVNEALSSVGIFGP